MKMTPARRVAKSRTRPVVLVFSVVIAGTVAMLSGCTLSTGEEAATPRVPIDSNPVTEMVKPKLTVAVKNGDICLLYTSPSPRD